MVTGVQTCALPIFMDRDVCLGAVAVSGRTLSQDVDLAEYFAHVLVKLCAMD